jgi:hypothetical protein
MSRRSMAPGRMHRHGTIAAVTKRYIPQRHAPSSPTRRA